MSTCKICQRDLNNGGRFCSSICEGIYLSFSGIETNYTLDWTMELAHSIRERDNHTCALCGRPGHKENRRTRRWDKPYMAVHHIDFDKANSTPGNLITLCRSCHAHIHAYFDRRWDTEAFLAQEAARR